MESKLAKSSLSSEKRIVLHATVTELCCGGQASKTPDTNRPVTSAIKHSVILVTLSAVALLTTRTAWMSIRF